MGVEGVGVGMVEEEEGLGVVEVGVLTTCPQWCSF